MRRCLSFLIIVIGTLTTLGANAEEGLRERLGDVDLAEHWIYDDFARAKAEATRSGKPLLVLFRCVPCQCAEVLDEEVTSEGSELAELERRFVCVRLVQMKGVNLHYFPFDRDLSFCVLFMHSDGTIYGRYGTRATISRTEMTHISLPSFRKSLERALLLHEKHPADKEALAAKRVALSTHRYAEEMPHLENIQGPTSAQNCIHCHMAGEGEVKQKWREGKLSERDIWVYPLPENIGLTLDVNDGLLVKRVHDGSPAERAGIKAGDELIAMNRQPLLSQSDIQWALHHLPEGAPCDVRFRRGNEELVCSLSLSGDWRRTEISWRDSLTGIRPGIHVRQISTGERKEKNIPPEGAALGVRYVQGTHARTAGIRQGDVILAVDGEKKLKDEGDFLKLLRIENADADSVRLFINRKGQTLELSLPLK